MVAFYFLANCNERFGYILGNLLFPIAKRVWHCACGVTLVHESISGANRMADIIFIVVTVVFFIISWLYVRGCDRL